MSRCSSRRWRSVAAESAVVLASASPRRLELLRLAGLDPVVVAPDIDECPYPAEPPVDYVARLARAKALSVPARDDVVVVAADTTVVLDGESLGKPRDPADARAMLRRLSGRAHTVSTGVAVVRPGGGIAEIVVTTEVVMAALGDATIARYVETGEPMDKAGAYGIQGRAQVFVASIRGSWTNVVGLPVVEALDLLRAAEAHPLLERPAAERGS